MAGAVPGRVLIYGGRGALGTKLIEIFTANRWWIASVDHRRNDAASLSIIVNRTDTWDVQANAIIKEIRQQSEDNQLDAILCVAGGWAGGKLSAKSMLTNTQLMIDQSVASAVIAAHIACKLLRIGGLLQLTGAESALAPTPTMVGYGLAKAAVHHLVKSITHQSSSGLPINSTVLCILPSTLDTVANRSSMPNADFGAWTPLDYVADMIYRWTIDGSSRPASGSLVRMQSVNGKTDLIVV